MTGHGTEPGGKSVFLFTHVPKTAGTTFVRVLERQFPRKAVFRMSTDADRFQASIHAYRDLAPDARQKIRCVLGHMPYGLHRWAPADCVYVAFVREPVERALSLYFYLKKDPLLREQLKLPPSAATSLESFLDAEKDFGLCNLQVRFLGGIGSILDRLMPPYESMPEDALDTALTNLNRNYSVVGLSDRFDASLVLMQSLFGWRRIRYAARNVSKGRPARSDFSPGVIARIEEDNAADMALFGAARSLLDRRLEAQGADFAREVDRFKRRNRRYQIAEKLVFGGPRFVKWRLLGGAGRAAASDA